MNAHSHATPRQRQQNQDTIRSAINRLTRLRRCAADRRRERRRAEFCRAFRNSLRLLQAGLTPLPATGRRLSDSRESSTSRADQRDSVCRGGPDLTRFVIPIARAGELFEHIRHQLTPAQLRELLRAGAR